jgi:hypothetical protein
MSPSSSGEMDLYMPKNQIIPWEYKDLYFIPPCFPMKYAFENLIKGTLYEYWNRIPYFRGVVDFEAFRSADRKTGKR